MNSFIPTQPPKMNIFFIIPAVISIAVFLWILISRFKKSADQDVKKYLLALESASNHIIITDVNGMILYANKGAEKMTGYNLEEMKGNTPRLWGGLMPGEFYKKLWQTKKDKLQVFSGEIKNRRKNQDEYFALMRISPIIDQKGNLTGFVSTEEDITERKQKEEELRVEKNKLVEAKAKNEAILASMGDGLFAVDREGRVIMINAQAERLLGVLKNNVLDKYYYEAWHMENEKGAAIPLEKRPVQVVLSTGKRTETMTPADYVYVRKGDTRLAVAFTITPILVGGAVSGAVVVFRDGTMEKEIDRAKSEFISIVSHQLRTPVSGLGWLTEELEFDSKNLTSKQKKYVKDLVTLSKRLIGLIEDLVNFSKIELKTPAISEIKSIEINDFIGEFVKEMEAYAALKKHTIILKKEVSGPLIVETSEKALSKVLQNLISNAIDYSPKNTPVMINADKADGFVKILISSKGTAISKEEQSHLFEKFYRTEEAKKIKPEGMGLGLYIAKVIIEEAGGKVGLGSADSEEVVFWFTIPLKEAMINKN